MDAEQFTSVQRGRATSRRALIAIAAMSTFMAASCSEEEHGSEEGAPTGAVCPTTQTLTYSNFGQTFMQTYCLRCHSTSVTGADRNGAPDDHNFDVLDDIRSLADHIDELAGSGPMATNTIMPKNDPRPTLQERQQLSEWLACAGPE